jgi:hypothetical protein
MSNMGRREAVYSWVRNRTPVVGKDNRHESKDVAQRDIPGLLGLVFMRRRNPEVRVWAGCQNVSELGNAGLATRPCRRQDGHRGRVDYHGTSRRYVLNGRLDPDVREALLEADRLGRDHG